MCEESTNGIPAPFDDMPTVEEPTSKERSSARGRIPPWAIPDDGPIPDSHHIYTIEEEIAVPAWALEAVRYRLGRTDPDKINRNRVEGLLLEYAHIREKFVTPDGDDAVAMLLDELGSSAEGGGDGA